MTRGSCGSSSADGAGPCEASSEYMMRSRRATSLWHLFFHYANIAYNVLSGVVLVPLYLRHIPVDLYGAWLATGNVVAWIAIVDPGISTIVQQRIAMAYGRRDFAHVGQTAASGLLLTAVLCLVMIIGALVVAGHVPGWAGNPSGEGAERAVTLAFLLASLGTVVMVFGFGVIAVNLGLQSSVGIGTVYLAANLAGLVATVVMLKSDVGLLALPAGIFLRSALTLLGNALYLWIRLRREQCHLAFSAANVRELLATLSFSFFGRIGVALASNVDSLILANLLGPAVVPVFTLTRRPMDVSRMFVERPATALMPALSHALGAQELDRARVVLDKLVYASVWILGLACAGFLAFNDDLIALWVGAKFYAGADVNVLLCAGFAVGVIVTSLTQLCTALGDVRRSALVIFVQGCVSLALIVPAVRAWGMIGAAVVPVVSQLLVSLWYFGRSFASLISMEREQRSALVRELLLAAALAAACATSFNQAELTSWPALVIAALGLTATYTILLALVSAPFRRTMRELRGIVLRTQ